MLTQILRWSILACFAVFSAKGSVILTLNQVGPDLVLSGSGTANLAALRELQSGGCQSVLTFFWIQAGGPSGCFLYGNLSGPSLPLTGFANVSSTSGNIIGIEDYFGIFLLSVPSDYVSGSALAGTGTFSGATLSGVGARPGTYVWNWGSGATADSLTLQVGVPEPSTIFTLGGALLGITAFRVRRRSRAREFRAAADGGAKG